MNQELTKLSDRLEMDCTDLSSVLMQTVMPAKQQVSHEQFVAFLAICNKHQLDPIAREIFAFPSKGGGIQAIVSIDGWLRLINEHPQYDGLEIKFSDKLIEHDGLANLPESCTVSLYRKDRKQPITLTEYMTECYQPKHAKALDGGAWQKKPRRMLQHKAVIQAARYAFGFAGILADGEQSDNIHPATVKQVKSTSTFDPNKTSNTATVNRLDFCIKSINQCSTLDGFDELAEDIKEQTQHLTDAEIKIVRKAYAKARQIIEKAIDAEFREG